jgi:hypothetical protein
MLVDMVLDIHIIRGVKIKKISIQIL